MVIRRDTVLPAIMLSIPFLILIAYLINPSLVYDQWIWKYYWGPVVADALGREVVYNGVAAREGYTLVSEITYGIIALISLYYIYRMLLKLKFPIGWKFCLAILPYILMGPIYRVLEDASFFKIPLSFWFISPLIYVQIAAYLVIFLVIGWFIENRVTEKNYYLMGITAIVIFIYSLVWFALQSYTSNPVHPLFIPLSTLIIYVIFHYSIWKRFSIKALNLVPFFGLIVLSPGIYALSITLISRPVRFDILAVCLILPSIVTLVVYLISRYIHLENLKPYRNPLNLSMLFGHALDGFVSYVSIYDPFHMGIPLYGEKHPVSFFLMDISGGILFPLVKIALILVIIYLLDVYYSKEMKEHSSFINFMKIGIFILGFAPGLRDLLRVVIGT